MGGGGGFLSKYNSEFFIDVIRLEFGKGLFALSTLGPVAVVFRRMLKTRVTLGHIPLALLNLIKKLIFAMFIELWKVSEYPSIFFHNFVVISHISQAFLIFQPKICFSVSFVVTSVFLALFLA